MEYGFGIDLGTTQTAAAVQHDGVVEALTLGDHSVSIPSVVFLRNDGEMLVGEPALRRASSDPGCVAREFKRRVGDPTPIILSGAPYAAELLMARVLRWAVEGITRQQGAPPTVTAVTHPANCGPYKLDLLAQAIRQVDLDVTAMLPEPVAAATFYASQRQLVVGEVVAVYDLGGGTFDVAMVRRATDGFEIIGLPDGVERLGGIDFDEAVVAHVQAAVGAALDHLDPEEPTSVAAMARLRQECVAAKETLSSDTAVSIPVLLPNLHTEVRLTRAELEAMIRPALDETIVALRRAIRSANLDDSDISAVLLVGGSSRIPLVAQMVGAELGRPIAVDAHPKDAVAFGAATAVADLHHRMVTPESVTAVLPEHRALGPDQRAPRPGEPVEPVEPDDQPGRGGTGRRRLAVLGAAGVLAVVALSGLLWLAKPGSGGDASPPQSSVSSEFPDARDTPPTTVAQSSTAPETGVEAERISPDIAPFEGQIDALTPFANDLELYTGRDGVEGLEQEAALLGSWYALADWCAANGQGRVGVCYDRAATFLDQYFERDPRTINTQTWGAPGAVGGVIADTYELTNGYLGVDSQVLIPELMDNRPGDAVLCEPSCSDVLDG